MVLRQALGNERCSGLARLGPAPRSRLIILVPAVVGAQPHCMMHAETRVLPAEHLRNERLVDLAALQEQVEDLLLPELLKGLVVECGQPDERAVGCEPAVGHQRVQMWMKMEKLAKCVDGPDHARRHIPAVQDDAVDLQHRLPRELGQLTEKPAVEAEKDPQTPGNREDELSVADGRT